MHTRTDWDAEAAWQRWRWALEASLLVRAPCMALTPLRMALSEIATLRARGMGSSCRKVVMFGTVTLGTADAATYEVLVLLNQK